MALLPKPSSCSGCHLEHTGQGFMNAEGIGSLGVMAIAEALGEKEADAGLPLRPDAPAGSVYERTLKRAGIDRQQMVTTNMVHCRPPKNLLENQWYEVDAVNHCRGYLEKEIERFQPKVILAMGGVPLKYLTGYAGKKRTITHVRGFYLDGTRHPGIPVVPTYHPSYIQRDKPNLLGVYRLDLLRAAALAKAGGVFLRPVKRYTLFPPIDVAERFLADCLLHPDLPITYDIETEESITGTDESDLKGLVGGGVIITRTKEEFEDTPEHLLPEDPADYQTQEVKGHTRITQIQFSIHEGEAIVLPWDNDLYSGVVWKLLALPNPKMTWNGWGFDDPVLQAHGCRAIGGIRHDLMWAWHHSQPDLPRGLQYGCSFYMPEAEPWKHRAQEDPGDYGGDDVNYLRVFGPKILEGLKTRGIYRGYERHIIELNTILVQASGRGVPVDDARRVELGMEVDLAKAEVDAVLQARVPEELRAIEPKEGYVNPKLADKRKAQVNEGLEPGERWIEREFVVKPTKKTLAILAAAAAGDMQGVLDIAHAPAPPAPAEPAKAIRWARLQPFLPNSGPQILSYIKWRRRLEAEEKVEKYRSLPRYANLPQKALMEMAERNCVWKVPKDFKTEKETTSKKELERLGIATGDDFFKLVIEHREYGKIRSTYVDGWAPGGDGAVHTTFTFAPATGQLSSRRPNVQNAPKHGKLAKKFRKMIRAKAGHRLIEIDKTAFHALTLGFEAKDPNYMRLAKLDIHSFVAANMLWMHKKARINELKLPPNPEKWFDLPDEELGRVLKVIKSNEKQLRDKKAKPAILGIGFGLGARKLFDMNRESFDSQVEAKKIQDIIKGLFPAVFKYQDDTRNLAHRQGFLHTAHDYIRWFFDVYHWDSGSQSMKPGKDSEAAIAFRPANNAFGMIKEEMLAAAGLGGWAGGKISPGYARYNPDAIDLLDRYGFINQIHDALVFHCQDQLVEECLHNIVGIMQSPSEVLVDSRVAPGGLVCGVEAMVSPVEGDWTELEVVAVRG